MNASALASLSAIFLFCASSVVPQTADAETGSGLWAGRYEMDGEGIVDTGNWLGEIHVTGDYAYSFKLERWMFLPESHVQAAGGWAYVLNPPAPDPALLTWAPPPLAEPATINVSTAGGTINMANNRDYIVVMPDEPVTGALSLVGGRNVVLIGGEIFIPHQGRNPDINSRRALLISHQVGTVHIEGLLMHGDDISEGIQTRAPDAIIQIQNCAVYNMHARDQVGFSDNHPDVIQTWGNAGELRVDMLTGQTDYQGLFFKADFHGPHGPVHLKRTNILGDPTSRYLFWMSNTGGGYPTVTLEEVYVDVPPQRSGGLGKAVWPDVDNSTHPATITTGADGTYAMWPTLPVTGRVKRGVPPGGNFVPASAIGIGYVSPGYR